MMRRSAVYQNEINLYIEFTVVTNLVHKFCVINNIQNC